MAKRLTAQAAGVLLAIGVVTAAAGSGCGGSTAGSGGTVEGGTAADAGPQSGCTCNGPASAPCRCAPNDASAGSCTLLASAYDQACQRDSDCVGVFLGNACNDVCRGACPTGAINARDDARYNADLNAALPPPPSNMQVACDCAFGLAVCHSGSCALGHIAAPPPTDASTDAGDARASGCASSTDCSTGDFCNLQIHGGPPGVCCPGFGCAPNCPNGVAKDPDGCDTCQCAPSADAGDSGSPCTTDADCGTGGRCGFPQADGCAAKGSCFPEVVCSAAYDAAAALGCACDGSEINVFCNFLPVGYASKPLLHMGFCGSDAGGG